MTKISKEEINHLAQLARLELSTAEKALYREQMAEILGYVEKVQKVKDIEKSKSPLKNVVCQDKLEESKAKAEDLLAGAPEKQDGYIKVRAILDDRMNR
jgi:aspartyl-tRNA(Asn)/glutamyl-tRNA(Gln) amidotransferase subunit C